MIVTLTSMAPKHFCLFILLITISFFSTSQIVNFDREVKDDSVVKKWEILSTLSFSSDKQKNNILDLNTAFELNRAFKNKFGLIGLFKNDATISGGNSIQNEGMLHIRYRDLDSRKLSVEGFVQYQWNALWGMEYRYLTGMNLRYKLFDKKNIDLYSGLGVFNEIEKWNWNGVDDNKVPVNAQDINVQNFRVNTYLKMAKKVSDFVDFSAVTFLQFPITENFLKPRWYFEIKTFIKLGKTVSLTLNYDHFYDQNTVVPIDNFYYSYSTGFQINL